MIVNAQSLDAFYAIAQEGMNLHRSGRSVVRERSSDGNYVFCDVCGAHASAATDGDPADRIMSEWNLFLPQGWIALWDQHLCPDCAAARAASSASLFEEYGQQPLEADDASNLVPTLTDDDVKRLDPDGDGVLAIPAGIKRIGRKAFMYRNDIRVVVLPDSVEDIGDFAFAFSSIERFEAPRHLRRIGASAFYRCGYLVSVELNPGLRQIGFRAFAQSAISALRVPAEVTYIGPDAIEGTPVVPAGSAASFVLDGGNASYVLDGAGGLYLRTPHGLALQGLLDVAARHHEVMPGTRAILANAYRGCRRLESVSVPEGVTLIGHSAFMDCVELACIDLPETLDAIETEGLANTAVESLRIPPALVYTGPSALAVDRKTQRSALHHVEVDPRNGRFALDGGLLCVRGRSGRRSVLLAFPRQERIWLPGDVTSVAPSAFTGATDMRELRMGVGPLSVHPNGFAHHHEATFRFDLDAEDAASQPCDHALVRSPNNQMLVLASLDGSLDLPLLLSLCDRRSDLPRDARYVLDRFDAPVYLDDDTRMLFEESMGRMASQLVLRFAERGDVADIARMAEHGFLTADNISGIIDGVIASGNGVAIAFLLDLKKRRFGMEREDFSL